jgi:hypothetical protein
LGQKIKDTLAFNQSSDVAHNVFNFKLSKALEPHSLYSNQSSAQAYKANRQPYTKNKAPIKRKALKERTKG